MQKYYSAVLLFSLSMPLVSFGEIPPGYDLFLKPSFPIEKLIEAEKEPYTADTYKKFEELISLADKDDPWRVYCAVRYLQFAYGSIGIPHDFKPQGVDSGIDTEPAIEIIEDYFEGRNKNHVFYLSYLEAMATKASLEMEKAVNALPQRVSMAQNSILPPFSKIIENPQKAWEETDRQIAKPQSQETLEVQIEAAIKAWEQVLAFEDIFITLEPFHTWEMSTIEFPGADGHLERHPFQKEFKGLDITGRNVISRVPTRLEDLLRYWYSLKNGWGTRDYSIDLVPIMTERYSDSFLVNCQLDDLREEYEDRRKYPLKTILDQEDKNIPLEKTELVLNAPIIGEDQWDLLQKIYQAHWVPVDRESNRILTRKVSGYLETEHCGFIFALDRIKEREQIIVTQDHLPFRIDRAYHYEQVRDYINEKCNADYKHFAHGRVAVLSEKNHSLLKTVIEKPPERLHGIIEVGQWLAEALQKSEQVCDIRFPKLPKTNIHTIKLNHPPFDFNFEWEFHFKGPVTVEEFLVEVLNQFPIFVHLTIIKNDIALLTGPKRTTGNSENDHFYMIIWNSTPIRMPIPKKDPAWREKVERLIEQYYAWVEQP